MAIVRMLSILRGVEGNVMAEISRHNWWVGGLTDPAFAYIYHISCT